MVACSYENSFVAFNSTSDSFAALTRELSSYALEEKLLIYVRPCIILYLFMTRFLGKIHNVLHHQLPVFLRITQWQGQQICYDFP